MKRFLALLTLCLLMWAGPALGDDEPWAVIPAGGKPAYMGIHGGTMPVSLLASSDGSHLFTFVGRTGNDFLEVLRKAYAPLPSLGNSTRIFPVAHNTGDLFAGNATASMRVLPMSAAMQSSVASSLQPFGLSEEPLRIEGHVSKPPKFSYAKSFRLFAWPDYLKPRNKHP